MKLLIADDEELTRTGVVSSIDWTSLGIDEVLQADDGIHGLEMAQKYHPEIILTDVRMPRMDGITMLEHIEHILPDTVVIFMSGYSDKEYLKAAIKLKAVNYIEKPLNPQDIREAVSDAIQAYSQRQHIHRGQTIHSKETASFLAARLSAPYAANARQINSYCQELSITFTQDTSFTVYIVKLDGMTELSDVLCAELFEKFALFLQPFGLKCIYTEKRGKFLIYFVYGTLIPLTAELHKIGQFLVNNCSFLEKYMVIAGDTFTGVEHAYQAYTSAVVQLQCSYFFPRNTFLASFLIEAAPVSVFAEEELQTRFTTAITDRNESDCMNILDQIFAACAQNTDLLQGQIKDFYFRLLFSLEDMRKQLHIPASESALIADTMDNCFCYQDMHNVLLEKVRSYYMDAQNSSQENHTITLIKDYISKNYSQDTLSVKDISSHVFLSTSYVCTFFKNETGKTLNQYLTEYRMEKAKRLLEDSSYKITDISSKVGYSDGNYFGKSFKKYSGFSPSEYREKKLS